MTVAPARTLPKLRAMHAVWAPHCPYSLPERATATVLILDFDEHRGCAWPSQKRIAERAGLSRRQAQRALASLVSSTDGPLSVTVRPAWRQTESGGRAPNEYRVELRATVTHKSPEVERHGGAQVAEGLCAKQTEVVRQTDGGLGATVAHDLSRGIGVRTGVDDLSSNRSKGENGDDDEPDPWGLAPPKPAEDGKEKAGKDPPQGRTGATPEPKPNLASQIRIVFEHWQRVRKHPAAKLDKTRGGKIKARLSEGFSVEQLCQAIDGVAKSEWHCGDNPSGTNYDDVVHILRDAPQVEKFMALGAKRTKPGPRPEPPPPRREPPPPPLVPPPRRPPMAEPSAEEREAAKARLKALLPFGKAGPSADTLPPRSRRELHAGLAALEAEADKDEPALGAVGGAS